MLQADVWLSHLFDATDTFNERDIRDCTCTSSNTNTFPKRRISECYPVND